jgi:hypothetical protein
VVQLRTSDELDCESMSGAGEGGLWVIVNTEECVQCRIAKLDRDLRVRGEVPVTPGAAAVRVGLGCLVSNPDEDVIEQIDPRTLKAVNQIETGSRPATWRSVPGRCGRWLKETAALPATPRTPRRQCASMLV